MDMMMKLYEMNEDINIEKNDQNNQHKNALQRNELG